VFSFFRKNQKRRSNSVKEDLMKQFLDHYGKEYPDLSAELKLKLAERRATWEMNPNGLRREEVLNELADLKIPDALNDIIRDTNQSKNSELNEHFRWPGEFFFMTKEEQIAYNAHCIIPFLCDSSFYTIYAYDKIRKGFLTFDIEVPEPEINHDHPRFTWDGLFVSEILHWWQCEIENNTIIRFGEALNLKWTPQIIESIENEIDHGLLDNTPLWEASIQKKYRMILD